MIEQLPSFRDILLTAKDVGHFVMDRLSGGAWAELPPLMNIPTPDLPELTRIHKKEN